MEVEPIYCAEQIVVPPDLADILKAYTKEIIRRQPADLVDFSAKYFANLANVAASVQGTPAPSFEQLRQVLDRSAGDATLTSQQMGALCSQAGISKGAVAKILEAGRFDPAHVVVDKFVFLLLAMSCASFSALIRAAFDIFGDKATGRIAGPRFVLLVSHLAPDMDPDITADLLEGLRAAMEGVEDISLEEVISNSLLSDKMML